MEVPEDGLLVHVVVPAARAPQRLVRVGAAPVERLPVREADHFVGRPMRDGDAAANGADLGIVFEDVCARHCGRHRRPQDGLRAAHERALQQQRRLAPPPYDEVRRPKGVRL